jgi:hypothetical protein
MHSPRTTGTITPSTLLRVRTETVIAMAAKPSVAGRTDSQLAATRPDADEDGRRVPPTSMSGAVGVARDVVDPIGLRRHLGGARVVARHEPVLASGLAARVAAVGDQPVPHRQDAHRPVAVAELVGDPVRPDPQSPQPAQPSAQRFTRVGIGREQTEGVLDRVAVRPIQSVDRTPCAPS